MNIFRISDLFVLLAIFFSSSDGFKILGVFPTLWKSHWNVGASVLKHLANAGHDVTFVSPFELHMSNLRNVILTNYPEGDFYVLFKLP
jgi:hypothetical protein